MKTESVVTLGICYIASVTGKIGSIWIPIPSGSERIQSPNSRRLDDFSDNHSRRVDSWMALADSYANNNLPSYEATGALIDALNSLPPASVAVDPTDLRPNFHVDRASWWSYQKSLIDRDLDGRVRFEADDFNKRDFLYDVLTHLAVRNPEIGYNQAMSLVASQFLILGLKSYLTGGQTLNRSQVYNILAYFIDQVGPNYFDADISGVHRDVDTIILQSSAGIPSTRPSLSERFFATVGRHFDRLRLSDRSSSSSGGSSMHRLTSDDQTSECERAILQSWVPSFLTTAVTEPEHLLRLWDVILLHGRDGWLNLLRNILQTSNCRGEDLAEEMKCFKTHAKQLNVEKLVHDIVNQLP